MDKLKQIHDVVIGPEVATLVPLGAQVIKLTTGKDYSTQAAATLDLLQVLLKNLQIIFGKPQ